jgi:hypothetical protein
MGKKRKPDDSLADILWGETTDRSVELSQAIALASRLASMKGSNRVTVSHVPAGRPQSVKDSYFTKLAQDLERKSQDNHVVLVGMIFSRDDLNQVSAEWTDFTSTKQ